MKNKGIARKLERVAKAALAVALMVIMTASFMANPSEAVAAEPEDLYDLMVRFNNLYIEIMDLSNQINQLIATTQFPVVEGTTEAEEVMPEIELTVSPELEEIKGVEIIEMTPIIEPEPEPEPEPVMPVLRMYTEADARAIAAVMHAEANGLSVEQKKAVAWCILNRVDSWERSIQSVVSEPGAFVSSSEYTEEEVALANEVLLSWSLGGSRELPAGYLYFNGNGKENLFRMNFLSDERYSLIGG